MRFHSKWLQSGDQRSPPASKIKNGALELFRQIQHLGMNSDIRWTRAVDLLATPHIRGVQELAVIRIEEVKIRLKFQFPIFKLKPEDGQRPSDQVIGRQIVQRKPALRVSARNG